MKVSVHEFNTKALSIPLHFFLFWLIKKLLIERGSGVVEFIYENEQILSPFPRTFCLSFPTSDENKLRFEKLGD